MRKPILETGTGAVIGPDPDKVVEPDGRKTDRIKVSISDLVTNERNDTAEKYASEYPDHVLSYQHHTTTPDQLESKFMEPVMKKNGEPVRAMGDVLCKQPRDVYERRRLLESELSAQTLEEVCDSDELRVPRSPRTPKLLKIGRG